MEIIEFVAESIIMRHDLKECGKLKKSPIVVSLQQIYTIE